MRLKINTHDYAWCSFIYVVLEIAWFLLKLKHRKEVTSRSFISSHLSQVAHSHDKYSEPYVGMEWRSEVRLGRWVKEDDAAHK